MVYFKARLGQAKFPAGSAGTIHTWGRWFAGPEMPDDPDDVALDEKPSDETGDDKPDDGSTTAQATTSQTTQRAARRMSSRASRKNVPSARRRGS